VKALTTLGHQVFALQRIEDAHRQKRWSGKIRLVKDNPYYDQYFHWHRGYQDNGLSIDHEMGNLILNKDEN
jgi:hypothetical protein